jgi:hypothetical protein
MNVRVSAPSQARIGAKSSGRRAMNSSLDRARTRSFVEPSGRTFGSGVECLYFEALLLRGHRSM